MEQWQLAEIHTDGSFLNIFSTESIDFSWMKTINPAVSVKLLSTPQVNGIWHYYAATPPPSKLGSSSIEIWSIYKYLMKNGWEPFQNQHEGSRFTFSFKRKK